jgi:ATP-binding cassette, subfamily A (ABC1), member 3
MSEGRLRCCGSSLFLKKTFGVGYQLTIEKHSSGVGASHGLPELSVHDSEASGYNAKNYQSAEESAVTYDDDINDDTLKSIVKDAVSEAFLLSNGAMEIKFQLPMGAASRFTPMFEGLDSEIEKGHVSSYGVSITTLDEVFLKVAQGRTGESLSFASSKKLTGLCNVTTAEDSDKSVRSRMDLDNDSLFLTHLGALFKKRAASFRRDKEAWLCTTILPTLFVLIGLFVYKYAPPAVRSLDPVALTLADYNPGVSVTPRNPIAYNNPKSFYSCQPGSCVYNVPVWDRPDANELYYYCGYQAELPPLENCSISDSSLVVGRLDGVDGATAEGTGVSDVFQVSETFVAVESLSDS